MKKNIIDEHYINVKTIQNSIVLFKNWSVCLFRAAISEFIFVLHRDALFLCLFLYYIEMHCSFAYFLYYIEMHGSFQSHCTKSEVRAKGKIKIITLEILLDYGSFYGSK